MAVKKSAYKWMAENIFGKWVVNPYHDVECTIAECVEQYLSFSEETYLMAFAKYHSYEKVAKTMDVPVRRVRVLTLRAIRKLYAPIPFAKITGQEYFNYYKENDINIDTFPISTKTKKTLKRNGFKNAINLKSYLAMNYDFLAYIPGLGKFGMAEVAALGMSYGIKFNESDSRILINAMLENIVHNEVVDNKDVKIIHNAVMKNAYYTVYVSGDLDKSKVIDRLRNQFIKELTIFSYKKEKAEELACQRIK